MLPLVPCLNQGCLRIPAGAAFHVSQLEPLTFFIILWVVGSSEEAREGILALPRLAIEGNGHEAVFAVPPQRQRWVTHLVQDRLLGSPRDQACGICRWEVCRGTANLVRSWRRPATGHVARAPCCHGLHHRLLDPVQRHHSDRAACRRQRTPGRSSCAELAEGRGGIQGSGGRGGLVGLGLGHAKNIALPVGDACLDRCRPTGLRIGSAGTLHGTVAVANLASILHVTNA
mmetsp:Transcript_14063/g.33469  ORF Transcript_14063/g.33469 Transcript_14063/m.33469 type:complete len:230 (+) Transcript_14063:2688-3377(+)